MLELSTVLALTQLGIRQSDWRRAGIRSINLHIVVELATLDTNLSCQPGKQGKCKDWFGYIGHKPVGSAWQAREMEGLVWLHWTQTCRASLASKGSVRIGLATLDTNLSSQPGKQGKWKDWFGYIGHKPVGPAWQAKEVEGLVWLHWTQTCWASLASKGSVRLCCLHWIQTCQASLASKGGVRIRLVTLDTNQGISEKRARKYVQRETD